MATGNTLNESTTKLQRAADDIAAWTRKWRIKPNETKSTYIVCNNLKIDQRSILLNGVRIPVANIANYLGMTLDAQLRWKAHVKKKEGNCKSNSEKCTGRSDVDPDCQCTISCSYINKCCDQYGHMVSNYGDVRKKSIST
jgi:hypothetical protein